MEVRDAETLCFAVVTPERDYVFRARDAVVQPLGRRDHRALRLPEGAAGGAADERAADEWITVGADGAFNMTNVPEEMKAAMGASLAQIERERRAAGKPEYSRDRGSSLPAGRCRWRTIRAECITCGLLGKNR